MKAVAYNIKPFEKEYLAKANQKKHDITLISNPLGPDTALFAEGKDAVIVFPNDDVSARVIEKLANLGIKYIVARSTGTDHIDKDALAKYNIKLSNIPSYSPEAIAEHAIGMAFALNRKLLKADRQGHHFDFRNNELIGFNFYGKTVGIIGLGYTGMAIAKIFNGLGCKVLGNDINFPKETPDIKHVDLETLLRTSDIISLHLPLTPVSKYLIQKNTISQMKDGVMLINISRGAIINTIDVIDGIESGKIGYLGLDVYEYEKGVFFENHENDRVKDPMLARLIEFENVLVTPHQAYLTKEALQEIANKTIQNLDLWQLDKNKGEVCACIDSENK